VRELAGRTPAPGLYLLRWAPVDGGRERLARLTILPD
jgi:hypothetical protein